MDVWAARHGTRLGTSARLAGGQGDYPDIRLRGVRYVDEGYSCAAAPARGSYDSRRVPFFRASVGARSSLSLSPDHREVSGDAENSGAERSAEARNGRYATD